MKFYRYLDPTVCTSRTVCTLVKVIEDLLENDNIPKKRLKVIQTILGEHKRAISNVTRGRTTTRHYP